MFKNVGHFFTAVAKGIVHAGRGAEKVASEAVKLKPEIEAVSGLLCPAAVPIEELAFRLFGDATHAVSKAGDVTSAEGLNVTLDAELIAAIEAIIPDLEKFAEAFHMVKPDQPAQPVQAAAAGA